MSTRTTNKVHACVFFDPTRVSKSSAQELADFLRIILAAILFSEKEQEETEIRVDLYPETKTPMMHPIKVDAYVDSDLLPGRKGQRVDSFLENLKSEIEGYKKESKSIKREEVDITLIPKGHKRVVV